MTKSFNTHPVFNFKDQIVNICEPLKKLDITYFCHVNINKHGAFSGINNNPEFANHYIKNQYYNVDIHLTSGALGDYVIWDLLPKTGKTQQMDKEAQTFGVNHTFTITKKNAKETDYFHFATHLHQDWFNQTYLSNLDLLEQFSEYFKEKVHHSKMLATAYDFTFSPKEKAQFCVEDLQLFLLDNKRMEIKKSLTDDLDDLFIQKLRTETHNQNIKHKESGKILTLAPQQTRCLSLLLAGKSSKEIGLALGLSHRSVEHYIQRVRKILNCKNSKEVLASYSLETSESD